MKRERGLKENADLGERYNHRLLNQSWLARKLDKINTKQLLKQARETELSAYGATVWGDSFGDALAWR
jgi:hypothetical protein